MNWQSFFAMGGYGPYVWSAYGISFVALSYLCVKTIYRGRYLRAQLQQELQEEESCHQRNDYA